MNNFNDVELLELVECYAEENDMISSEEELSTMFDEQVLPSILEQHAEPGIEFTDTVMVNEEFNNWSDSLCKDGLLHSEQYNNYYYIGSHSDE